MQLVFALLLLILISLVNPISSLPKPTISTTLQHPRSKRNPIPISHQSADNIKPKPSGWDFSFGLSAAFFKHALPKLKEHVTSGKYLLKEFIPLVLNPLINQMTQRIRNLEIADSKIEKTLHQKNDNLNLSIIILIGCLPPTAVIIIFFFLYLRLRVFGKQQKMVKNLDVRLKECEDK